MRGSVTAEGGARIANGTGCSRLTYRKRREPSAVTVRRLDNFPWMRESGFDGARQSHLQVERQEVVMMTNKYVPHTYHSGAIVLHYLSSSTCSISTKAGSGELGFTDDHGVSGV